MSAGFQLSAKLPFHLRTLLSVIFSDFNLFGWPLFFSVLLEWKRTVEYLVHTGANNIP